MEGEVLREVKNGLIVLTNKFDEYFVTWDNLVNFDHEIYQETGRGMIINFSDGKLVRKFEE